MNRAGNKISTSNTSSSYNLTNSGDNPQEEFVDDPSNVNFIDISNVEDIIDDKELTETSIDDAIIGNTSLECQETMFSKCEMPHNGNYVKNLDCFLEEQISKPMADSMTVEFIGCSPSGRNHNYLNDDFNFIQTLPRSYKVQGEVKNREILDAERLSSIRLNHEDNSDNLLLSRFDMTKSVKSILTVQEKLAQDFPSLPPQVI